MSNELYNDGPVVHKPTFIDGTSVEIPELKILQQDGTVYEGSDMPDIDEALAVKVYKTFAFHRVLDERMVASQRQGRLSFYMAALGEEAASIGGAAGLKPQDMIMSQYREQGALMFRGFSLENFMNQMFSNDKDLGKGRQMPIHYGSKELNYMTISSPLGTQIPQATGYAYGQKLQGLDAVTLCYFGEGAASEGDFHAGLNMAAVQEAPVIFFCRNNGYAISTPADEQFKGNGIASRGVGYGIKTLRVDGNDILAVVKATQIARAYALKENAPVLIEAMSYRLGAHSTSDDPSGYRTREEEQKWQANDPIVRMKNWMLAQNWWDEAQETALYEKLREKVLAAVKVAEKIEKPHIDTLISDVYDVPSAQLTAQLEQVKTHINKYPEAYPFTAGKF
ncbi:thiamine pyrophosphate-dependent dehydrogenase E1 component subunit alpha [Colwellia sp. 1_MG-2023]|uniref:thiamine pyrophosphate-dependent dehydrogenase E1 component subunit alpha n=1 Tax=unclassified Colwellia TaxID=196834 RepID=UPI001C080DA9|nr:MULTISPECIES: thiamine pyrophosphate-dependent dehydrogenase E1 component subunit alpha [unclassified Colwellia]MBU2925712.1 thiamine pyrophosphate-dependent dehydrogenase E1 component subunit alpha [Colwellia sp. C2M11]MDO6487805.1 thiamine pyrophosphate-dependent dehydrogenase E1 component subunit alpha [Colwellia sp. 6_MG-2023]MDO6651062.1 thiamine pyrophosphate-dependent dehydrogenase E1 component subunit alpha [Colwellia sp. 3_MG-2023]MDO6664097.1 thiamine pyrophosphate-dependent dehydr